MRCQAWVLQNIPPATKLEGIINAQPAAIGYSDPTREDLYQLVLLQAFGKFVNGQPVGIHWLRKEGGSFLVGQITNDGSVHGDVIYLYPNLRDAVSGFFEAGKLIRGQYAHVKGVAWEDGILLPLVRMTINCQETRYDPSTGLRIRLTMSINSIRI